MSESPMVTIESPARAVNTSFTPQTANATTSKPTRIATIKLRIFSPIVFVMFRSYLIKYLLTCGEDLIQVRLTLLYRFYVGIIIKSTKD